MSIENYLFLCLVNKLMNIRIAKTENKICVLMFPILITLLLDNN